MVALGALEKHVIVDGAAQPADQHAGSVAAGGVEVEPGIYWFFVVVGLLFDLDVHLIDGRVRDVGLDDPRPHARAIAKFFPQTPGLHLPVLLDLDRLQLDLGDDLDLQRMHGGQDEWNSKQTQQGRGRNLVRAGRGR